MSDRNIFAEEGRSSTREACSSVIRAEGFGVAYANRTVLHQVDLTVSGRGIHALMGPSGSGKSTFLLAVGGLLQTAAQGQKLQMWGRLDVKPECLQPKPERLRSIGFVFQKPLPFQMSVFDNVAVVLREHGVPKSEWHDRVSQALQDAGLWLEVRDSLNRPASQLSGGQQQRLCMARTLALNPCLLLLDEPCSSLDPVATTQIEETLKQLAKERCVLLVTHNLGQARRLANDVSLFWPGPSGSVCIESRSAREFFETPRTLESRRYLEAEWGSLLMAPVLPNDSTANEVVIP